MAECVKLASSTYCKKEFIELYYTATVYIVYIEVLYQSALLVNVYYNTYIVLI